MDKYTSMEKTFSLMFYLTIAVVILQSIAFAFDSHNLAFGCLAIFTVIQAKQFYSHNLMYIEVSKLLDEALDQLRINEELLHEKHKNNEKKTVD